MSQGDSGGEVLMLSRWHALVGRARRLADVDALLAHPHAASLVPAMPPEELFYAIKQVGIGDCHELIELCHPRQVQTFIDLDAWHRDRIADDRIGPWLEAVLAGEPESVSSALEGLDPEVWLLALQSHVRVYDWSLEQVDVFGEDQTILQSPDNVYLIEILDPTTPAGDLAQRILAFLFKHETPDVWRRLIDAVRIEIHAELEEEAFRYRRGRLADLGFVEHAEAIEAYAWKDPRAARRVGPPSAPLSSAGVVDVGERGSLPAPYARALGDASFLAQTLARIDDDVALDAIAHQLVALANRVLVVDDVDVGEPTEVQAAGARMCAYLSIALEHLSGGDLAAAEPWARGTRLIDLHRIGFSLTLELKRRADRIVREGWLSRADARPELLDPPEREALASLRKRRPLFFAGLTEAARLDARGFATQADLARAHQALDDIELVGWLFFDKLKVDPAATPRALSFSSLLRTAVVHQALGKGFRPEPLLALELREFVLGHMRVQKEGDERALAEDLRAETSLYVEGLVTDGGARVRESARRLVAVWLDALESELCGLMGDTDIDPRFVGGLWLVGS